MARKKIYTESEIKERRKIQKRKWFRNKYKNDEDFREIHKKRLEESRTSKKQKDRQKIKEINESVKISSRGYQNQYKDYYTLEELENYD